MQFSYKKNKFLEISDIMLQHSHARFSCDRDSRLTRIDHAFADINLFEVCKLLSTLHRRIFSHCSKIDQSVEEREEEKIQDEVNYVFEKSRFISTLTKRLHQDFFITSF